MINLQYFGFIIMAILLASQHCFAQDLKFKSLTEENVFDRQPVLTISQDKEGRLWFAGESGVYSYNSRHINSLVSQDSVLRAIGYVTKIAITRNNHLFIAGYKNLHVYDIDKRRPLTESGQPFIRDIIVSNIKIFDNSIYLCSKDGLYLAKPSGESYALKLMLSRKNVQSLVKMDNSKFALASEAGVELFTLSNGKIMQTENLHIPIHQATERAIPDMYYEDQILWVATRFNGLYRYDMQQGTWSNFDEKNSNLLSNYVRKIVRDPQGQLLVGTLKGLSIKKKGPRFQNYKHNSTSQNSLSQNSIYDIFIDDQEITWIGTYYGGLNAIYPDLIKLNIFSTKANASHKLNSDIISNIAESKDAYWIGTEEEGVTRLDKKTGQTTTMANLTSSSLVKDLYVRNEKLYIAQYAGGYTIFDIAKHKTTHYKLDDNKHHLKNNIYSIYVDPLSNIYLGTNDGLYATNKGLAKRIAMDTDHSIVNDFQEDSNGTIYILRNSNIYRKSKKNPTFSLEELDDLTIHGFYMDSLDNLWITTQEAVYKKPVDGKLVHIVDFKNNNLGWPVFINQQLWITSKNGLVFYDIKKKYSNILTQQDGLPVKNLLTAKLYLSRDRQVFICTLNGLVTFDPKTILFNRKRPIVLLENIEVNETPFPFDQLVHTDRTDDYQITLHHNENFLSVNFSSSNFIKPEKNKFRYKLAGFDKEWIETNIPAIRYTNIPEGTNLLSIYASNNDMLWSETPLNLTIKILPPFWKTWWAYLLYAISFAIIIHFIIKFIVEREILLNAEKEHQKKISFFTQVSHEIRTPLTLITAPLEEIIAEISEQSSIQQKVIRVKKNANKLLAIVNELLDFKKFDEKKMMLKKSEVHFREYVEDCFYLLSDLAQTKQLNYYIRRMDKIGLIHLDVLQFDKVLFNLLSNAIKYTPNQGTVYLELNDLGGSVELRVLDNGVGIAAANQFKIFEEYYREEQTDSTLGTGIGLALTKAIVEQHGGKINCTTEFQEDQQWTVFSITLHIEKQVAQIKIEEEIPITSPVAILKNVANLPEILLIVDDNAELLAYIVSIFQDAYTVITARDGEEGLQKANYYLPDIIISDIMMPKMNGSEFCKAIKTNMTTSHIPFILLTAVNDHTLHTETLSYGANIYLTKPFDQNHLRLSVNNLIQISRTNRKEFLHTKAVVNNPIDHQFIQSLDELIESHLTYDGFDVNYIARNMGMSAPILYRKLKAITDLSLNNYVKIYRLTKAKELLQTALNINEVAWAVGFSDRKYFSKEFKKHFGVNPSAYLLKTN